MKSDNSKLILGLVIGAAVGAAVGAFLASEKKEEILEKLDRAVDQVGAIAQSAIARAKKE